MLVIWGDRIEVSRTVNKGCAIIPNQQLLPITRRLSDNVQDFSPTSIWIIKGQMKGEKTLPMVFGASSKVADAIARGQIYQSVDILDFCLPLHQLPCTDTSMRFIGKK